MEETESITNYTTSIREVKGIPRESDGLCGGGREHEPAPPGDERGSRDDIAATRTAEAGGGDDGVEGERGDDKEGGNRSKIRRKEGDINYKQSKSERTMFNQMTIYFNS